ncbi:hypothetical protein DAPPUDRAFT_329938 [Daphnia pulex]|uniref:Uncharacterized protein n=1 Tax=Daphnia pulex TaxID=6669 RepID=E9HI24_DAPPU|nr:hypothetical protein DAPPUDRAFT_329938 [Daphnia pulex]|eukprot:EFX68580.1 hypothetical protein DAPPUDRAFT_329938 [Daphnia pulex]
MMVLWSSTQASIRMVRGSNLEQVGKEIKILSEVNGSGRSVVTLYDRKKILMTEERTGEEGRDDPELQNETLPKESCFQQFKEAIKDCQLVNPDDNYILKWLLVIFILIKPKKCYGRPPEVLKKYYSVELAGVDKFGSPICIVPFGQADWRGILQSVSKRDYLRYISYLAEMGMAEIVNNSKLAL